MAVLDGAKEELGWLKVVFAVSAAIDASLIAWLAQKYNSGDRVLIVLAFISALALTAYVAWINTLAYRRIRELETSQ